MGCIICKGLLCDSEAPEELSKDIPLASLAEIDATNQTQDVILIPTSKSNKSTILEAPNSTDVVESSENEASESATNSNTIEKSTYITGGGVPGRFLSDIECEDPEYTAAVEGLVAASGKFQIGCFCRSGIAPLNRRKENQDSICVYDNFGGDSSISLVCVLDGHGTNGAFVSHFLRDRFPSKLCSYLDELRVSPFETITKTAMEVSDELGESEIDTYLSGTTLVMLLVVDEEMYVANVGDSRAVLGVYRAENNYYEAVDMSRDHKPDIPEERDRIINSGGRVYEWGGSRVWLKDADLPGLAMSRSFGDLAAEGVGVIPNPEIKHTHLNEDEQLCMVLASDGVWEFMSSQECIDFVVGSAKAGKDAKQTAYDLMVECAERWDEEEESVDDITVSVVFFNGHKLREVATRRSSLEAMTPTGLSAVNRLTVLENEDVMADSRDEEYVEVELPDSQVEDKAASEGKMYISV